MTGRIDKATAAAVELTLNGIKWTVSPITFRDLGLYMAWLRQKVMTETMSACVGVDKSIAELALREAQNPTQAALEARASGPDADLYLAWLSVRKSLPGITLEDLADQLPSLEDVQAISNKAAELGGGTFTESEGASTSGGF